MVPDSIAVPLGAIWDNPSRPLIPQFWGTSEPGKFNFSKHSLNSKSPRIGGFRGRLGSQMERRNYWGSKLLAQIKARSRVKKKTLEQKSLWENWETPAAEVRKVAKKFVLANCYDQQIAGIKV